MATVTVLKFADILYRWHDFIRDDLERFGYNPPKKMGQLLQWLGTEFGRQQVSENIWCEMLAKRAKKYFDGVETLGFEKAFVIVDDMRFKNELDISVSEFRKSDIETVTIRLECAKEVRKRRCDGWRENDTHPSEVDLDDWVGRFDLVVNTELSEEEVKKQITEFLVTRALI